MTALIPALIACTWPWLRLRLRCRYRRNFDFFRRFEIRLLFDLVVDSVRWYGAVLFGRRAWGLFVLAGPASSASAATGRKLATRLRFNDAGFGVGITDFLGCSGFFTCTGGSSALLRSFPGCCFLLARGPGCGSGSRRTFLRGAFAGAFAGCRLERRLLGQLLFIAHALKLHATQRVVTDVVYEGR